MKNSFFLKILKFQHNFCCFELLWFILDPVVQKLVIVNKQQNINVNKKFCLHFLKIKVGFFSLSAQTLSKEAKMGEMHREMPKLANCDM